VLAALRAPVAGALLDVHADPDHHRAVLTLAGGPDELVAAVLGLAQVAVSAIVLDRHRGVHPRLGALDVVPFAPLGGGPLDGAVAAREAVLAGLVALGLPCFRFGPLPAGGSRSLPELRRVAFSGLAPDAGPSRPHPTAGATAVGARGPLVAWNAWVQGATPAQARAVAAAIRDPWLRALGLEVTGATQVSCNLLEPAAVTPLDAYRRIEAALPEGAHVVRCELVGLVPEDVLRAVPEAWWARLDLDSDRALEPRAAAAGVV
jgi:glutamate formiminotransferase / 5-formyltetrahydrofolate cyclo-ligase